MAAGYDPTPTTVVLSADPTLTRRSLAASRLKRARQEPGNKSLNTRRRASSFDEGQDWLTGPPRWSREVLLPLRCARLEAHPRAVQARPLLLPGAVKPWTWTWTSNISLSRKGPEPSTSYQAGLTAKQGKSRTPGKGGEPANNRAVKLLSAPRDTWGECRGPRLQNRIERLGGFIASRLDQIQCLSKRTSETLGGPAELARWTKASWHPLEEEHTWHTCEHTCAIPSCQKK